jgi:hypothetical protein
MSPTDTVTQPVASIDQPPGSVPHEDIKLQSIAPAALRNQGRVLGNEKSSSIDPVEFLPQPSTTVSVVERWNHPKANVYRTLAILYAFIIMGANDATYGVSITTLPIQASCQPYTGHHTLP